MTEHKTSNQETLPEYRNPTSGCLPVHVLTGRSWPDGDFRQ